MKLRKLLEFYIYLTVLFLTELLLTNNAHCMKNVQTRRFSDPYFAAFRPEKTPYMETFHTVADILLVIYTVSYMPFPDFHIFHIFVGDKKV